MRLWHYKLIKALPRQQLLGAWRECIAIAGSINKNGTPNHLLVNYVMNYDLKMLREYSAEIADEMTRRGYKANLSKLDLFNNLKSSSTKYYKHYPEHNADYFNICYYNLYEKYIRGGITDLEWEIITCVKLDV